MRKLLTFTVVGILTLVVGELAFKTLVADRFVDPQWFHEADVDFKAERLSSLDGPLMVFAGTSQAAEAIDPAAFERPSFNAAVNSGGPQIMEHWLPEVVLERSDVDHLVWGVSPLVDLNEGVFWGTVEESYQASFGGRPGLAGRLLRGIGERSTIVRYQPAWASNPFGVLVDGPPEPRSPISDANGFRIQPEQRITDVGRDRWASNIADFDTGGPLTDAFIATVSELRRRGVQVTIVEMPLPPRTTANVVGGHRRLGEIRRDFDELIGSLGVDLIVPPDTFFADDRFTDFTHLTDDAAHEFSLWLAAEMTDR